MEIIIIFTVFATFLGNALSSYRKYDGIKFDEEFKKAEADGGFTPLEMQGMLQAQNHFRHVLAKGGRNGMPSAADLPLLEWDDRLAYEAHLWLIYLIKNNKYKHPNTGDYQVVPWEYCGQNLGKFTFRNPHLIMLDFEKESDYYTYDSNSCKPSGSYHTCGHALQLYYHDTTHVGCQARNYNATTIYVVCNYGPIRSQTGNPYVKGTACSACKGAYSFCLDGLCTTKKMCDFVGKAKCTCPKKDSDCKNGATVDPTTCQCTKNCPANLISPLCNVKCHDGDMTADDCALLYADPGSCKNNYDDCIKHCGNCIDAISWRVPHTASNVLKMESYPRADCVNTEPESICSKVTPTSCGKMITMAVLCARTCNRCRLLGSNVDYSPNCSTFSKSRCSEKDIKVMCQKLCSGT